MGFDIFGGSNFNSGIDKIKQSLYRHDNDRIVISNRNSDIKSAVIISDDGVNITNPNTTGGLFCSDGSVSIQGTLYNTSSGGGVRKGPYAENDRTRKIFTYRETVLYESLPKEVAAEVAGQAGINLSIPMPVGNSSIGMDGVMNIITDVAAGPKPHVHSISMKHVHRIEPPYLYRIPTWVTFIKNSLSKLTSFLNA